MTKLILDIKNKLQNFNNEDNEDLFSLIGNFKHLEKNLILYKSENMKNAFKTINDILNNAFNNKALEQNNIFELLQELLYIEKFITDNEETGTSNMLSSNNKDTFKKVAIGLGLGALGFAVSKAFIDSNRSSRNLENNEILSVAYYLSRYDHDGLFNHKISATKAIENIAKILDIKPNTLRNKRDYFDAFLLYKGVKTKSERRGYKNAKLSQQYNDIINENEGLSEMDVKEKILKILNTYSSSYS